MYSASYLYIYIYIYIKNFKLNKTSVVLLSLKFFFETTLSPCNLRYRIRIAYTFATVDLTHAVLVTTYTVKSQCYKNIKTSQSKVSVEQIAALGLRSRTPPQRRCNIHFITRVHLVIRRGTFIADTLPRTCVHI